MIYGRRNKTYPLPMPPSGGEASRYFSVVVLQLHFGIFRNMHFPELLKLTRTRNSALKTLFIRIKEITQKCRIVYVILTFMHYNSPLKIYVLTSRECLWEALGGFGDIVGCFLGRVLVHAWVIFRGIWGCVRGGRIQGGVYR